MPLSGTGLLSVWNDVDAAHEAAFNDWYRSEHLAERVGVPGFVRARRYHALDAGEAPAYGALYETESPEVLASKAYRERLDHPSALTVESLGRFRNMHRTACRVAASFGRGVGGALAVLRPVPDEAHGEAFDAWLAESALPATAAEPGILGAHLCLAELELTRGDNAETRARGTPDRIDGRLVLIEATAPEAARGAVDRHLGAGALARYGVDARTEWATYRMIHALDRRDL
jgi:hypothetical protein